MPHVVPHEGVLVSQRLQFVIEEAQRVEALLERIEKSVDVTELRQAIIALARAAFVGEVTEHKQKPVKHHARAHDAWGRRSYRGQDTKFGAWVNGR